MLDKHQSHLVLNTLHFTLWYNIYVFFWKVGAPGAIFSNSQNREVVGSHCHNQLAAAEGQTAEGFLVFLRWREVVQRLQQLGKKVVGRWLLVVFWLVVGCCFFCVVVCFLWWLVGRGKKERQNNKQKAHSECSKLCLFKCVKVLYHES